MIRSGFNISGAEEDSIGHPPCGSGRSRTVVALAELLAVRNPEQFPCPNCHEVHQREEDVAAAAAKVTLAEQQLEIAHRAKAAAEHALAKALEKLKLLQDEFAKQEQAFEGVKRKHEELRGLVEAAETEMRAAEEMVEKTKEEVARAEGEVLASSGGKKEILPGVKMWVGVAVCLGVVGVGLVWGVVSSLTGA